MMRTAMSLCLLLATIMPPGAKAASRPAQLTCQAEMVASCNKQSCDIGTDAVFYLDLLKKQIEYCRGERCDTLSVTLDEQIGKSNKLPYLLFTGENDNTGLVHGIISLSDKTFRADGDGGDMFGTCKDS